MNRLLIAADCLPVSVDVTDRRIAITPNMAALAAGLRRPHLQSGGLWFGRLRGAWQMTDRRQLEIEARLAAMRTIPVFLPSSEFGTYDSLANDLLWPLLHGLSQRSSSDSTAWEAYQHDNQHFADLLIEHYQPGDLIWVHDYELMLVPALVREAIPHAKIGFFLHTPFPPAEVFKTLQSHEALLRGVLGADVIGLQTPAYERHFRDVVSQACGCGSAGDAIFHGGRLVQIATFPMGVDADGIADLASRPDIGAAARSIRDVHSDRTIILAVDRAGPGNGVLQRLFALERLLDQLPTTRRPPHLIQILQPGRSIGQGAADYPMIEDAVRRINAKCGAETQPVIQYLTRPVTRSHLVSMYRAADIMVSTPLHDAKTTAAKEYVASHYEEDGILILSSFAGPSFELTEAIMADPSNGDEFAGALQRALEMPRDERQSRMRALRRRVLQNDCHQWAGGFLSGLRRSAARGPSLHRMADAGPWGAPEQDVVGRVPEKIVCR